MGSRSGIIDPVVVDVVVVVDATVVVDVVVVVVVVGPYFPYLYMIRRVVVVVDGRWPVFPLSGCTTQPLICI